MVPYERFPLRLLHAVLRLPALLFYGLLVKDRNKKAAWTSSKVEGGYLLWASENHYITVFLCAPISAIIFASRLYTVNVIVT